MLVTHSVMIVDLSYQLSQDKAYNPYDLLQSELSTVLTRNRPLGQQMSINIGISTLSTKNDQDYGWRALGAISGTLSGYSISKFKIASPEINRIIVPIYSSATSEYLGDSDRLKDTLRRKINDEKN